MSLADRFRRFRRRPKVELVRLQPLPPPSAPAAEPPALPAPPRPRRRSAGLSALYGPVLSRAPYAAGQRPEPLGRGPAHDKALYRDQVNPWRDGTPDPPPLSLDLDQIREELYAPPTYWWER